MGGDMDYRVIDNFCDLQDDDYYYGVGDTFPRPGNDVSDKRVKELSGTSNAAGKPLIEKVTTDKKEAEDK
jgi:hypothetical protein